MHADEYFQDDFREMMEYYRVNKREARREILENVDFKSFSVHDMEAHGDEFVSAIGEIVYGDGDTEEISIDLLKEKNKWKVEDAY